jgi:hypothetical protein
MDLLAVKFSMLSDEALACYAAKAKQSKHASSEARKHLLHLLEHDAAKEIAPLVKEPLPDAAVVVCRSDEVASRGSVVVSFCSLPNRSVVFIDPSSGVLTFWLIDESQLGSVFLESAVLFGRISWVTHCAPMSPSTQRKANMLASTCARS